MKLTLLPVCCTVTDPPTSTVVTGGCVTGAVVVVEGVVEVVEVGAGGIVGAVVVGLGVAKVEVGPEGSDASDESVVARGVVDVVDDSSIGVTVEDVAWVEGNAAP